MTKTDHTDWEARCRRCGRCCYEKIESDGEVFYTEVPCEKLDLATRLCTVYERRHELRRGCSPLTPAVLLKGILPADCPYVSAVPGYRGPHLWDEGE